MRERERLVGRIRQLRRAAEVAAEPREAAGGGLGPDEVRRLQGRVEHLEQMVQGLQDSVHRESSRQEKRIAELEARVQPAALSKALSEDVRGRGL
jgi:uncharacterized protein YlxW (UPF0749 family)